MPEAHRLVIKSPVYYHIQWPRSDTYRVSHISYYDARSTQTSHQVPCVLPYPMTSFRYISSLSYIVLRCQKHTDQSSSPLCITISNDLVQIHIESLTYRITMPEAHRPDIKSPVYHHIQWPRSDTYRDSHLSYYDARSTQTRHQVPSV
jgi:hypothetical protein